MSSQCATPSARTRRRPSSRDTASVRTADGLSQLANAGTGIDLGDTSDNTVGGIRPFGNVVSGNSTGVAISGSNNVVAGNLIGVGADGHTAVPNGGQGVLMQDATGNLIGRETHGRSFRGWPNVVSANAMGVQSFSGSGNQILGNLIGVGQDGTTPLGNQVGIWLIGEVGTTVGSERDPNVVANSLFQGVAIGNGNGTGELDDTVSANSIFANGSIGIDLGDNFVTPNDLGDSDTGPNGLQNFPVITSAARSGGNLVVQGTLNSLPMASYRIELFANSSCDPTGYGQGHTYLGKKNVLTDLGGNATFTVSFPLDPSGPIPIVTSTATDQFGSTSEFSACSSNG